MSDKPEGERVVTGNFEVALALTQQRTFKMTGYVYSDDTANEINTRIDRYQDVLDRQVVRCDIITKEAQISGHRMNLEALKSNYEELASLKAANKKLTSQQNMSLTQFDASVRQAVKMIDSLEEAIAAARKKLAPIQ